MKFRCKCSQHWLVEVWFDKIKGKQGTVTHTFNHNTYEVEVGGSGVWDQLYCILRFSLKQNKISKYKDYSDSIDNNLGRLTNQWSMPSKLSFEDNAYVHIKHNKDKIESKRKSTIL